MAFRSTTSTILLRATIIAVFATLLGCQGARISDPLDVSGYVLTVTPSKLTVFPGTSGSATVTINRSSFVDPVTLSMTGLPSDIAGSFSVTSVSGLTSVLSFSVPFNAVLGVFPITITSAGNNASQSVTLVLTVATPTAGSNNISSIDVGANHSCAIKTGGLTYCWGSNEFGQVGDGTTIDRVTPTLIGTSTLFSSLGAGAVHTCGVSTIGAVFCWGNNFSGALGDNTTTDHLLPNQVLGGLVFTSVTAAGNPGRSCGLTNQSATYCWGDNSHGEIGDGSVIIPRLQPTLVSNGLFGSITGGSTTTCGIRTGGAAFCWGYNFLGQIGDSNYYAGAFNWTVPTAVIGGLNFLSISAGDLHTCGVTTVGAAYCWGDNALGELGDSTIFLRPSPNRVYGGIVFTMVRAGDGFTCGISTAGDAYCWGFNGDGQLGDGTLVTRYIPTQVVGGLKFVSIRTGDRHACGLTHSGAMYCWGDNQFGQLGDGTLISHPAPAAVVFP